MKSNSDMLENQTYSRHTKDTEVLINFGRQCLKNSFLLVD
ncbi:hypothetical protein T01_10961 [Trichinella spiralis]|uniref:Uncharacterized protein n=1 Tax=Trichinella spiralis TaxID=6334 RepID=A0A0V0Z1L1_TRISP|nr:hypothetical protein T01_10961 [Trichinella spiralis]